MSYNELVNLIKSVIAANNSQRITGNVLQNVLLNILDTLYNSGHSGGTNLEELTVQNDATFHGNVTIDGILTVLNKIIASLADIDTLNSENITTEYLLVTKAAHFFQLIIDQLRANKGAIIISGGQCVVDYWEPIQSNNVTTGYKVYYRSEDGNTENARAVHQSFLVGDQVICQSLGGDGIKVGTNDNITTTYYWRLVTSVSTTPTATKNDGSYIDEGHNLHHWIIMSNTGSPSSTGNYDAANNNVTPNIGDEIVQLGYRGSALTGNDLKARQCAIVISAYPTKDSDLIPPSFVFYQNINTFALGSANRGTYIDATGAYFKGKLVSSDGTLIDINPDGFNADVEYYQLVPNESPIIKPETSKTVAFRVLYVKNGDGKMLTSSEMQNLYVKVNNGSYIAPVSGSNYFSVTVTSGTLDIGVALYLRNPTDDTYTLKDQYVTTIVDLGSVTNGVDGRYSQYIYQNSASQPARPTSSTASIPSGWSETASTPSAGLYIWRSERVATPTGSGVLYGDWSVPVRLSGIDGIDGEDGIPGEDGVDAESWALLPSKEIFEVRIDANAQDYKNMKLENIIGILYTDLQYQVAHIVGDDVTIMSNLTGYSIVITSDNVLPLGFNSMTVDGSGSNVLRWPSSDNANHNWLAVTNPSSVNYQDYYYLHSNGLIDYMPMSLNVALKYNNRTLASHVVKLVFNADHIFAALEDGLISIYQGLSGDNSGVNWKTGFSQIKQRWDNINLNVSNIERAFSETSFTTSETVQYLYYSQSSNNTGVPNAPTAQGTLPSSSNRNTWTTKNNFTVNANYPRMYYSKGTRANASSNWTWSAVKLYKYWDAVNSKAVFISTIVNSADLDIKADEIKQTVSATYQSKDAANNQYIQLTSQINQTASNISLSVEEKTMMENPNYYKRASLSSLSLIDSADGTTWKARYSDSTALIQSHITGHIFRFTNETSPACSNLGLSGTNNSAILSSYLARVMTDYSSISTEVHQGISVVAGGYYSMSVWIKRHEYVKNSSDVATSAITLGVYDGNTKITHIPSKTSVGATVIPKAAFTSDGMTLITNTNIVSYDSSAGKVAFSIKGSDWYLLVWTFKVNSGITSIMPYIKVFGSTTYEMNEFFISRPCIKRVGSNTVESESLTVANMKTARSYVSTVANLLSYTELSDAQTVDEWPVVVYAGGTKQYSKNTTDDADLITAPAMEKLWNVDYYPGAMQLSGSVAAVCYDTTTGYRRNYTFGLRQKFTAAEATEFVGKHLMISAYVRRVQKWGGTVYRGTAESPISTNGIYIQDVDSHIQVEAAGKYDSIVTASAQSTYYQALFNCSDNEWHRIWMVFTIASSTEFTLAFKNYISNGVGDDWQITKPKLEIVDSVDAKPTAWADYGADVTAGLKRTGIDIGNGKIRLDAENTEITGNLLTQGDASFGGVIKAATLYSPFIDINFDSSNVYIINPRNGSNYITRCRFSTSTSKSITLPDASAYGGLQLRIYGMPPLSRRPATFSRAYIVYPDGKIFYPVADANDRLLSFTSVIEPCEGSMITMISLFSDADGLGWYVLSGKFYVNDTLIEI